MGTPDEPSPSRRVRLHIMVSRHCPNQCAFCLEDAREREQADFGDPEAILEAFPRREAVLFTCGEPTLHPRLVELVRRASELGYLEIELVTNGRLLGREGLAARLVSAGLTGVTVSIHSHRPEVHDRLTGRRSFLQTLAGLRAVLAAGAPRRLTVRTSTVVVRENLQDLPETVAFLCGLGVQVVNLNYVEPSGRAARRYGRFAPRMSRVAEVLASVGEAACREVVITGIPPCVLGRGLRPGLREEIWLWRSGRFERLVPNRGQVHGPPCEECVLRQGCDGVWEPYARRFGWDEFRPVRRRAHEGA